MLVNPIKDGIVLDHIKAGNAMEIYHALGLDELDVSNEDLDAPEQPE